MKVINLIGQPGAGKSTTAFGLAHELTLLNLNCELVTEYAKDLVWREMAPREFQDQLYITAKQNHRLDRLRGKVDYVVTDSSLVLGAIYARPTYYQHYEPLLLELFRSYDNEVYLIKRVKPYSPVGRNQNSEEAEKIYGLVVELLDYANIPYTEIAGDKDAPKKILKDLIPF